MTEPWSLPDVLQARVRTASDRPFFSMIGEPALSVGEMELRSRRLANGLRELGVGFGDRVLVMMPNCTEFVEAWLAINRLGAVLVTVNTAYRGSFLEHVATNSDARVMIVASRFLPTVLVSEAAMPRLETLVVTRDDVPAEARTRIEGVASCKPQRLRQISFESIGAASERGIDVHVAPSDLSAIVYTSGTTGKSKGVMIPHAQMYLNPLVYLEQLGLGRDDVFYSALPLFHTNALALQVYGALIAGCRVHLAPAVQRQPLAGRHPRQRRNGDEPPGCHDRLRVSTGADAARCRQCSANCQCRAHTCIHRAGFRAAVRRAAG